MESNGPLQVPFLTSAAHQGVDPLQIPSMFSYYYKTTAVLVVCRGCPAPGWGLERTAHFPVEWLPTLLSFTTHN